MMTAKAKRDDASVLRGLIGPRRGARGPLPKGVRQQGSAYVKTRKAEGASDATIAAELGVSHPTIKRWRRRIRGCAALVPVSIVSAELDAPFAAGTSTVVVTTPRGLRIEGLDMEALCALIARVG